MTKFLTLALIGLLPSFAVAQCTETSENKVLLVGDSWAFFMGVDQTINNVFDKWGHTDSKFYTNLTIAENGAETDDFLLPSKQQEIASRLMDNPSIKVVHLSIGGNDVLGEWNINFTQAQTDSLENDVYQRLVSVMDFIKSVRPDVKILWSGYVYPNFEEVIESAAPFQTSHPFYGTWEGMGFPTFQQINDLLNHFSNSVAAYAATDPRVEFIKITGLMQYTYGQNTPLGVAPGGTYPPFTVPLPEGNPVYPSPKNSMRDYGLTRDCFHLSPGGYFDLIEYHTQKFYHKELMHDLYLLPENNAQTGSVSSTGNVSTAVKIGEESGERFAAVLSFNTTGMPDTILKKASIFLRRESLAGNNPINGNWQVKVVNGHFGTTVNVEAADYTATAGATATPCRFGSNGGDGHWVRLDLPASVLPFIKNDASTQFIISLPDATGGVVIFNDASDPDFAPVLDLTYDINTAGIAENTANGISVYPNPSNGLLYINTQDAPVTDVQLVDVFGKVVIHKTNVTGNSVDISSLPAGTYTLRVSTQNNIRYQRIIRL